MEWFRVYTDCLINFFLFFTLDLFVKTFASPRKGKTYLCIKFLFLIVLGIFSCIPNIPYFSLISCFINLLYVMLTCSSNLCARFIIFLKYELYYYAASIIIALLQSALTMDINIYATNQIYAEYTNIIGSFLVYIIFNMYIILKQLSAFPSGRIYKRYFLGITGLSVLLLVTCSMLLGSNIISQENVVPFIFSLLLIISLLCISIYRKVISVLEENTISKIEAEKHALEQDYYTHVQESLSTLSLLRHDFKNHLILLQGYASSGRLDELQNHINRLYDELAPTVLIETPSAVLSAIINAKNEDCKRKGISFTFEQHFSDIYFDEFHLITIFSNLLDNAITAAAKCEDGFIHLKITTLDSYLEIDCVNSHIETITKQGNRFLTTKNQKEIHGLGIKSMTQSVEKLRGEMQIDYTMDTFHVNILMPNYK